MSTPTSNKFFDEIFNLVISKGGALKSQPTSAFSAVSIVCSANHTFSETPSNLKMGKWCRQCLELPLFSEFRELLKKYVIVHQESITFNSHSYNFVITVEGQDCVAVDVSKKQISPELLTKIKAITGKQRYLLLIDDTSVPKPTAEFLFNFVGSSSFFASNDPEVTIENLFSENKKQDTQAITTPKVEQKDIKTTQAPTAESNQKVKIKLIETKITKVDKIGIMDEEYERSKKEIIPRIKALSIPCPYACKSIRGYIRVSTEEQKRNGNSLVAQESDIREYAKRSGLVVEKIYCDVGISGKKMANRPALQQVLKDLKCGEELVCANMTRLSRSIGDAEHIADDLHERRIVLRCLDIDGDSRCANTRMFFTFKAMIAKQEREAISARVRAGIAYKASHGKLITKPPFGYKSAGKGKGFIPDPHEQGIIQMIRDMKINEPYMTIPEICRRLDNEKVICRKANKWHRNTVQSIMLRHDIPIDTPETRTSGLKICIKQEQSKTTLNQT